MTFEEWWKEQPAYPLSYDRKRVSQLSWDVQQKTIDAATRQIGTLNRIIGQMRAAEEWEI